jgi:hypothetical protein
VVKIAGARISLGFVLGPTYGLLVIACIFIWAVVLFFSLEKHRSKDPSFGCIRRLGAIWSSLLDLPGVALAMVAPGKIPFC